jgi:hypothetical protein
LIYSRAKELRKPILGITPDDRKKPDKYFRIEGNLEPLNRLSMLILNEEEKNDPHMQRLESQFKSVSANSKTMDGPDAAEGAVHIIKNKMASISGDAILFFERTQNPKRF